MQNFHFCDYIVTVSLIIEILFSPSVQIEEGRAHLIILLDDLSATKSDLGRGRETIFGVRKKYCFSDWISKKNFFSNEKRFTYSQKDLFTLTSFKSIYRLTSFLVYY